MIKVHKSWDINQEDIRPIVVSLGEHPHGLPEGALPASRPGAVGAAGRPGKGQPGEGAPAAGQKIIGQPHTGQPYGGRPGTGHSAASREAADLLLNQAGSEAVRLISEAREQALEIERNAYATGYEAGLRQARMELDIHKNELREQVQNLIDELEERSRQELDRLEPEVLELSLQVAEKIVGMELERSNEAFYSLVRAALTRLKQGGQIRVRVSDTDALWLSDGVAAGLPVADEVQVQGEPRLPVGSCVIETDAGTVDASVPVQLRRIREMLREGGA